jgi:hypothetical protein
MDNEVAFISRKAEYNDYIENSSYWADLSSKFLQSHPECALCSKKATVAHHKKYPAVFGTEDETYLTPLCTSCHHNYHFPPSIKAVKEQVLEDAKCPKGTKCPICERHLRQWKRALNAGQAAALIYLVKKAKFSGEWVEMRSNESPRFVVMVNDFSQLVHWGLIEKKKGDDNSPSGIFRATQLGISFVAGEDVVPTHVYLLNNEVKGWSHSTFSIKDALKKKFDYDELLNSASDVK